MKKPNTPELLIKYLNPPELPKKYKVAIFDKLAMEICGITGESIAKGVAIPSTISSATANAHEYFKYSMKYVSPPSARMFKWVIGGAIGNMYANDTKGEGGKPMVSRESATKQGRLCWVDLIRSLSKDDLTVCIFTHEAKRRLWPFAPVGVVGSHWQIYLNTDDYQGVLVVDHQKVLQCLGFLGVLYEIGFNKRHMRESLFDYGVKNVSYTEKARLEGEMQKWRKTKEFLLAVFVLQREN